VSRLATGFFHGTAWYPELWQDCIDEDIALMRAAGIDLVRIGEFAWSSLESREGCYEWSWLDDAMDRAYDAGMAVLLCTPTCTPPLWLTSAYPETLRRDVDGRVFGHGSRGHGSLVSRRYRSLCRGIVTALARRYGAHPALVGWQIDNELLGDADGEYSDEARRCWHAFLRERYGDVTALNRRWATAVWSQTYPAIENVPLPGKTPFGCWTGRPVGKHHTSLMTDWGDFISSTARSFIAEQVTAIREHSTAPITHNAISPTRVLPEDAYADVDLAATDLYRTPDKMWTLASRLDLLRGSKMTADRTMRPFLVTETSPSQNGGTEGGHPPHPRGFLAAEAALMLALGGNAFCYWLWRQQRAGIEHCHGSVITAWGSPGLGWEDVCAAGRAIACLAPTLRAHPPAPADIAILHSRRSTAMLERGARLWEGLHPVGSLDEEVYRPLLERGIWRDRRSDTDDWTRYRVVISAFTPIIPDALVERMEPWLMNGGTWIVGPMSGCRTDDATVPVVGGLGPIDALAGMRTRWTAVLGAAHGSFGGREQHELVGYACGFEPIADDCRAIGIYTDGPQAGVPWAVERRIGRGRVVVLGALPRGQMGAVFDELWRESDLWQCRSSWGVMVVPRGRRREVAIAVNTSAEPGWVMWPPRGGPGKRLPIEPHAVRVLRMGSSPL